jgi:hypothetical protein
MLAGIDRLWPAQEEHETNMTGDAPTGDAPTGENTTGDAPTGQVKWPLWNVKGVSRRCREYCDRLVSVAILLPVAGGSTNSNLCRIDSVYVNFSWRGR